MNGSLSERPAFETRCISSLEKVFADEELTAPHVERGTALRGEVHAFQIAYRSAWTKKRLRAQVKTLLDATISLRAVGLVPSEFPVHPDHDEHVLRATPGLYPDPLYPYDEAAGFTAFGGQWRSLWVTVELPEDAAAGHYPIKILLTDPEGEELAEGLYVLEVVEANLPEQRLVHTEWFHADCLANYYQVDVFSEAHWKLIDAYVDTAVRYGMNMILTPLFTPPLDTAVGGERLTVQLVEVRLEAEGAYAFDFSRLERWIKLCLARRMCYFEFSHLFTQWGAKHAPKIMGWVDGKLIRLFGWETDATGKAYSEFLDQFLPRLVAFLREQGIEDQSYFHVSDEPHKEHLEVYRQASRLVERHLEGFPRIDALSDISFYEHGLVPTPIPSSNHIEPFLERVVEGLWTYYCCSQYKEVANRFFCLPSARNRVLGFQLYKFKIAGFLHWGYNFWNSQYSLRAIDPYRITDSDNAFPSGDSFVVYPGDEGPIVSLRLEVFREALQDLRALELLERLVGRERTLSVLEEGLAEPLTFKRYPVDPTWLLGKRDEINQLIAKHQLSSGGESA